MPVVTIAPKDALLEKLKSNMQEVRARGGELYVFADADSKIANAEGMHVIRMPGVLRRALAHRAHDPAAAAVVPRRACAAPTWTSRATWPERDGGVSGKSRRPVRGPVPCGDGYRPGRLA